jgi:gliding motility-associated-like protein
MKRVTCFFIILFFCILSRATTTSSLAHTKSFSKNTGWAFEQNRGQVTGADSSKVNYFYKKGNLTMFLMNSGISYQFEKTQYPEGYRELNKFQRPEDRDKLVELSKQIRTETYRMDIELLDANPNAEIIREGESPDYIQYYNHNVLGVHSYQKITYKNIYPNIDWVIYVNNNTKDKFQNVSATASLSSDPESSSGGRGEVKYDFIVHPGGNPQDIKLKTHWVEDLKLNSDGSLSLQNRMGTVTENKPISFQAERSIATNFQVKENIISFNVSDYNPSQELVIDPSIAWATLYGGAKDDGFRDVATDSKGNIYVVGQSESTTNIASGGFQMILKGSQNSILIKFNSEGNRIWSTYYGGTNSTIDYCSGVACDLNDNIYIVGLTTATIGIATPGAFQSNGGVSGGAYIAKFRPNGMIVWATYYISSNLRCIAIDKKGCLIIVGDANSFASSTLGSHQSIYGGGTRDGFIAKFDSLGSRIWSSFYGGSSRDYIWDCALDQNDNIYLSGATESRNNIGFNGFQNSKNILFDSIVMSSSENAFLVKLNSAGIRQWGTYYGSDSSIIAFNHAAFCTTDKNDNVYLFFAVEKKDKRLLTLPFSTIYASGHGAGKGYVLVKFNSTGIRQWATSCGDTNNGAINGFEGVFGCSSDNQNNIYISGNKSCGASYFVSGGFQTACTYTYSINVFLGKYNENGYHQWGTYFGGDGGEGVGAITVYTNNIVLVGFTDTSGVGKKVSSTIPYKGFQSSYNGGAEGFAVKICQFVDTVKLGIVSEKGTVICATNLPLKFTAVDTFEGNSPHYSWRKNGIIVGPDTNIYSPASISNNDTIECRLISSATCIYKDTVWSNKLIMKIKLADTTYRFDTICSNQTYPFKSQLLNISGIYKDSMMSSKGCDSFVFLHLYVKPISFTSFDDSTSCSNPSYFFNGENRTVSGIYKDTFPAANGCDSIVTLFLKVKSASSPNPPLRISRCPGQSYFFNGQNRTTSGTYTQLFTNSLGCDSIQTLILTILTTPIGVNNPIWACNPFTFKGKAYTSNAIVIDTIRSSYGCDSLLRFNYIYLKPVPTALSAIPKTVCDSVIVNGIVHKTSFSFIDTARTTQNIICDSTYQTTSYTIKYTPSITLSTKQEDTFFKGESIRISANNIKNYLWSTGSTQRDISIKLTLNEAIYLIAWNDTECKDTAYTNLTALDATILDFPTGFNPMSKDHPENRTFRPNVVGKIERIQLDIYNRLGEKIYSSSNLATLGWDGTYKGTPSPQGVYTYLLEYTTNKRVFFKTGEVQLVR